MKHAAFHLLLGMSLPLLVSINFAQDQPLGQDPGDDSRATPFSDKFPPFAVTVTILDEGDLIYLFFTDGSHYVVDQDGTVERLMTDGEPRDLTFREAFIYDDEVYFRGNSNRGSYLARCIRNRNDSTILLWDWDILDYNIHDGRLFIFGRNPRNPDAGYRLWEIKDVERRNAVQLHEGYE